MTVSEMSVVMNQVVMRRREADPDFQPNGMMVKATEYGQRFATNKNQATIEKIRECALVPLLGGCTRASAVWGRSLR